MTHAAAPPDSRKNAWTRKTGLTITGSCMAETKESRARYRANLQGEVDGSALYRALSKTEKNPDIARVYAKLASIEEAHAEFWRSRLRESGGTVPLLRPGTRTRILRWLARRFGPQFVLPTINTLEQLDSGQYDKQPDAAAEDFPPWSVVTPASSRRLPAMIQRV